MTRRDRYDSGNERRDRIYRFLVAYKTAHGGASPTVREMARAEDTVPSVIHFHLRALESGGRISLVRGDGDRMRHIAIPGERWILPKHKETT